MASFPGGFHCFWHCIYHSVLELFIVAVILFCGTKMRLFIGKSSLDKESGYQSRRMVEVNRQLTYTLILQAILPLVAVLIGAICTLICMVAYFVASFQSMYFLAYMTLPIPLIPVLNPLITILVVKQYRQHILWKLGGRKTETSTVVTVTMTPHRTRQISNADQISPNQTPRRHTTAI
jgi:hypothetical protein